MAAFEDRSSPDLDQFKGGKWTDWLNAIQSSATNQPPAGEHSSKRDVEVARLHRADMSLFGYRPATDKFYLAVCEYCGQLAKPQSMNIHYERKHKSKRIMRLAASTRTTQGQGKHSIDRSNHRVLSPPNLLKHIAPHRTSSTRHEHATGRPKSGELSTTVERERHGVETNSSKNHKFEKTVTKLASPPACESAARFYHSGGKNTLQKPGGTIHLNEIPESHVVKSSSRHSSSSSSKHYQRQRRTSESSAKSHTAGTVPATDHKKSEKVIVDSRSVGGKFRKNHDGYHHHYHQAPRPDTLPDSSALSPSNTKLLSPGADQRLHGGTALVVLEKTLVPAGGVKVNSAQKRSRPLSGSFESSVSPPRRKIPSLHSPAGDSKLRSEAVPNSVLPTKTKKKTKKILPLKAREYDPNEHCGVCVKEDNSHCRRSLTCKVHPLSAKRAVAGRRKQFDELVIEHGREKQRLKEQAASPAAALRAQAIQSPPTPSSVDFAVPSPVPKAATPLSAPIRAAASPHTPSLQPATSPSVPKAKPTVTLFPRIFAAWHVDCWDSDEVSEDFPPKMHNLQYCMQSHPQPLTVFNFHARRTNSRQVSFCRTAERQLEAASANINKFGSKSQKPQKSFSFTPIPATTFRSTGLSTQQGVSQLVHRTSTRMGQPSAASPSASAEVQGLNHGNSLRSAQSKSSKTSKKFTSRNLPPAVENSTQLGAARVRALPNQIVTEGLVRAAGCNSDAGHNLQANEQPSTSLFFLNDVSYGTSPQQNSPPGNYFQMAPVASRAIAEEVTHPMVHSQVVSSESSISKYSAMQPHSEILAPEQTEHSALVARFPNGLHPLPRSVLQKQGAQSVTLSGNIGALTSTGDDNNFTGHPISQTLKNINSNNNFVVQGEGIPPRHSFRKKQYYTFDEDIFAAQQNQPHGGATAVQSTLLQDDNDDLTGHLFSNVTQNTVNLSLPYTIQNSNFQDAVVNEEPSLANDEMFRLFCSPAESTDSISNMTPLEQMFGASSGHPTILQGSSTSVTNPARTDLRQNFVTR